MLYMKRHCPPLVQNTFVMKNFRIGLFFVLMALTMQSAWLSACSSAKHSQSHTESEISRFYVDEAKSDMQFVSVAIMQADSVSVRFMADSMRLPHGAVVYKPIVSKVAASPVVNEALSAEVECTWFSSSDSVVCVVTNNVSDTKPTPFPRLFLFLLLLVPLLYAAFRVRDVLDK